MQKVSLNIGDFMIRLSSAHELFIEIGYEPFIAKNQEVAPDIVIECFENTEFFAPATKAAVFEAADENLRYYSIFKIENALLFEIYDQQKNTDIQQTAIVNNDFTQWKIYSVKNADGQLLPLIYPLGPIVMQYMLINRNAIMIHASCIFDGQHGRIFSGFSGAGKSTMSKIWGEEGYLIINDDRLLLREIDGKFYAYNTPMYYADKPKRALLGSVFLIRHSPANDIKRLGGAAAVSKVLAFCIQNNFDSRIVSHNLQFMSALCAEMPVYALGVVPDRQIIDFILENEKK
jgi:hypothetical protein